LEKFGKKEGKEGKKKGRTNRVDRKLNPNSESGDPDNDPEKCTLSTPRRAKAPRRKGRREEEQPRVTRAASKARALLALSLLGALALTLSPKVKKKIKNKSKK
jgi:hypothetical protein